MDTSSDIDKFFIENLQSDLSTSEYQRLCSVILDHPIATELARLDPFSDEYRSKVHDLYLVIRGRADRKYDPTLDEASSSPEWQNVFTDVSPWSFRDSKFVSEMLYSWGHIFSALKIADPARTTVLEYGTGSGQLLLQLARLGCQTYAVDIDEPSLQSIRDQAKRMDLNVNTECGVFGDGFVGKTFDRIVFFEAFHHAFDFMDLLRVLRFRLNPGGFVVFCGEPILPAAQGPVPFPWGPRLDGLSAICIRRFGWMELGFTRAFFGEALNRTGWRVSHLPFPLCGRADVYVAVPTSASELAGNSFIDMRLEEPGVLFDFGEWSPTEIAHRWTIADIASLKLLHAPGTRVEIEVDISNYLPVTKSVEIRCGNQRASSELEPGQTTSLRLSGELANRLEIATSTNRPSEVSPGSSDHRSLGVAVGEIRSRSTK